VEGVRGVSLTQEHVNYQWRKGSIIVTNMLLSQTNASYTLYNVTTNDAASYRVVITNLATTGTPDNNFAALTVVTATVPAVITQPASNITASRATLNGVVNPN